LLEDISGVCEGVDWVVNFAAKTFVDHSIRDPEPFVQSNVVGTIRLLEEARRQKVKRFIQVSTDEVYGSILKGAYGEAAPINPSNVYAASKAGADALAIAYARTFGLHTIITRTENNYSTHQHPQKVIPAFVKALLAGKPVPVYGDGLHVRQWLHVSDHCSAIRMLLETDQAPPGSVWHVAGNQELTNIDLARRIIAAFPLDGPVEDFIQYVPDHDIRPGHDRRYALSTEKITALGWKPVVPLEKGIPETVAWYRNNPDWLTP
jgi:dTDP-glucose 4,6-dehydratase